MIYIVYNQFYIFKNPFSLLSDDMLLNFEIEADTYAYNFIIKNNYNIKDIENYIKKNFENETIKYKNQLNLFEKRINILKKYKYIKKI